MKNEERIRKAGLERYVVRGKMYHTPLPFELEDAYCYVIDSGHCIIVVLENEYQEGKSIENFLAPAPIKTIIRHGYEVKDGCVWSRVPYSKTLGLICEPEDDEFKKKGIIEY